VVDFLRENKEWLFSGIGVALILAVISVVRWLLVRKRKDVQPGAITLNKNQTVPADSAARQVVKKGFLTPLAKKRIKAVLREHWPSLPWAVAFVNYPWEILGARLKAEFLAVSFLYVAPHYLFRRLELGGKRAQLYASLRRYMCVIATILLMPLLVNAVINLIHSSKKLGNFEYRIDNILEHEYRIYNSPLLPEPVYKMLKRNLGRPFYPELRDEQRRYDSIKIFAYHLRNTGIITYEYKGKSYLANSTTQFHVMNYGEMDSCSASRQIICLTLPDSQEIKPNKQQFLPGYKWTAVLSSYSIVPDFHFARCFCAKGCMTPGSKEHEYEGFLIDLRPIVHPPLTVDLSFVTDRQIYNVNVYSLERWQRVGDWLLARPYYAQDERALVAELTRIGDREQLDSIRTELSRSKYYPDPRKIRFYRCSLRCSGKPQIFLLRYMVQGPIL
jgi:hypothetical protein